MVPSSVIPEHELLVSIVKNTFSNKTMIEFPQNSSIDWNYLSEAARYHHVIPFLYSQAASSSGMIVPPDIIEDLKQSFLKIIQFNILATSELLSLYDIITGQGIPVIPYKGPILAQILYNDIKYRQFDDVDILVRSEDVQKVKQILIEEGYRNDQMMTTSQEAQFLKSHHHYLFSHPTGKFPVELHWDVSPRIYSFNLDLKNVWERAKYIPVSNREVLSLSIEDILLILCEHGTRHYWKRLSMICDIGRITQLNELDWDYLLKTAKQTGTERVLLLGISLAKTLLDIDVPPVLPDRFPSDRVVERLTQQAVHGIISQKYTIKDVDESPAFPRIKEELFYLEARERFSDRARYYFRRAITPEKKDWEYVALPDSFAPFYSFIRIGRLMGRYKWGIRKWFAK